MALVFIRPISFRLGAEEQDAASMEKYLAVATGNVHVFELNKDSKSLIHRIYVSGSLTSEEEVDLVQKSSVKNHFARFLVLDGAARAYLKLNIAETIHAVLDKQNVPIHFLFTHTTALAGVSFLLESDFYFSRSVNFEPLHYLQENTFTAKSPFVFFSKVWLTLFERRHSSVWVISPNDLKNYSLFCSPKSIELYPLFQLFDMVPLRQKTRSKVLSIGFLGSTFNVSHNRASFDFISSKLASALLATNQKLVQLNVYGVKSPSTTTTSNLVIHGWKASIDEIFQENDLFLIPYFGGTGMQSKLFEPLAKGKPVIANPKAFAGYPFVANFHYFAAASLTDYIDLINQLADGGIDFLSHVDNSNRLVSSLFSRDELLLKIRASLTPS
jgi:hypothetical protein